MAEITNEERVQFLARTDIEIEKPGRVFDSGFTVRHWTIWIGPRKDGMYVADYDEQRCIDKAIMMASHLDYLNQLEQCVLTLEDIHERVQQTIADHDK